VGERERERGLIEVVKSRFYGLFLYYIGIIYALKLKL
jgi:hypothetical protein